MSYSFTIRASSPVAAIVKIDTELGRIVESQPIHQADRKLARNAAEEALAVLQEDDGRDIEMMVNGSVTTLEEKVVSVNFGLTARLVRRV